MNLDIDARFLPFGNRVFVAGSMSDKAYIIDANVLADRALPTLDAGAIEPSECSDASVLEWYLRRAGAIRFADIDDTDGTTRNNFAKSWAAPVRSVAAPHEPPDDDPDESILELLRIGTSRSAWVARNWPDSAPESFSMSFGRAFYYVVTLPATDSTPGGRSVWATTEIGLRRVSGLPTWAAALRIAATTSVQLDVCADLEIYAQRYRHEFALQTLLVEAGRIAGDLMSGAVRVGWGVSGATLIGEPVWEGWFESHAVVLMVRMELSGPGSAREC